MRDMLSDVASGPLVGPSMPIFMRSSERGAETRTIAQKRGLSRPITGSLAPDKAQAGADAPLVAFARISFLKNAYTSGGASSLKVSEVRRVSGSTRMTRVGMIIGAFSDAPKTVAGTWRPG